MGEFGVHLQALVFFERAVEGFAGGGGEACLFAVELLFDGADLEVDFGDFGAVGHEVAEHGGALGLEVGEFGFQVVDDAVDVFGGGLWRQEVVFVLVVEQLLAGAGGVAFDLVDFLVEEGHLFLRQLLGEAVHEGFAGVDHELGDGVGGLGVIGLGADDQYAGVVVEFGVDPGQEVVVEAFQFLVFVPHP